MAVGTGSRTGSRSGCGCGGAASGTVARGPGSSGIGSSGTGLSGCGCGGTCGGTCGCAGSCGGACGGGHAGAAGYVRPRFFSGMLLTEDDLQAVDDYAVAKRRLTNRHLFGSGVVCGLEVDCDPCRPGWLTVTSGYALDCCGNDIVVGCPEELDALVLLDELRRRSGLDCGEPCEDKSRRSPHDDYLLVVRYDEHPEEPVAPYSQDHCAVGDCEFSRVREGYRFELVCACDIEEPEASLFDRVEACMGSDDEETKKDAAHLMRLMRFATTQAQVEAAEEASAAMAVEVPTAKEFDAAKRDLAVAPALDLLTRSTLALAADADHAAGNGPQIFRGQQRRLVIDRRADLARTLRNAPAIQELPAAERDRALRVIGQAEKDPAALAGASVAERMWLTQGIGVVEAPEAYSVAAEAFRDRVIQKMDQRGKGSCEDRERVSRLRLDRLDKYARTNIITLVEIYLRLISGCLCDLVNPPCPTCTELRVPLARVRIEDCRVTDVCSLVRQWVLAPRTLNYWLPFAELARDMLLDRCCPDTRRVSAAPATKDEMLTLNQQAHRVMALVRSPRDTPVLRDVVRMLDEQVGPAGPIGSVPGAGLGQPLPAQPAPPPPPAAGGPAGPAGPAAADRVQLIEEQLHKLTEELKLMRGGGQ
jgi:hypothetical protein